MHDGGFCEGVGSDEFVVGWMEAHDDDAHFLADAFATPGEVAGVKAESTEFCIAATSADDMDSFPPNPRIGWLAAGFESSLLPVMSAEFTLAV